MELIAASRIVRAQQAINAARPYTERMREVVVDISTAPEAKDHWVLSGTGDRSVIIVLAGDRGLSGAFNANVLREANEIAKRSSGGGGPAIIAVGRKAQSYFNFRQRPVAASFSGFSDRPTFENARQIVEAVKEELDKGNVGQVHLVSTRFNSVGVQQVEDHRLVPLDASEIRAQAHHDRDHDDSRGHDDHGRANDEGTTVFEFEPEAGEILDQLLPQWLEAEVYTALLESAASFHVAQQRAMKAATDNADDLIKTLRRQMNRARQDAITTEIIEISGGAEALRQAGLSEDTEGRPDVYVFPQAS